MEATIPDSARQSVIDLAAGRVTGTLAMLKRNLVVPTAAAYTVRYPDDSFAIVLASLDNSVITLPLAANVPGMQITVINAGADGAALVSISPNASDAVVGSIVDVTGGDATGVVQSSGTVNKDWQNTKATANKGDYTTLVSDGGTKWYITDSVGIWVSES